MSRKNAMESLLNGELVNEINYRGLDRDLFLDHQSSREAIMQKLDK